MVFVFNLLGGILWDVGVGGGGVCHQDTETNNLISGTWPYSLYYGSMTPGLGWILFTL